MREAFPPFYTAVTKEHVASIMCAYPLLNGSYSCQNPSLITGLLDDQWGFTGFVRSDSAANVSITRSASNGNFVATHIDGYRAAALEEVADAAPRLDYPSGRKVESSSACAVARDELAIEGSWSTQAAVIPPS